MKIRSLQSLRGGLLWGAVLCSAGLQAQTIGGTWQAVGPGPAYGGQVEGITNREVTGAVNALAPHPSNASILYVGAVNGGVWRTTTATAASPTWTRLTDQLGSLSVAALEFDPTDASHQTLVAGVARTSSLSSIGGALIGMLRTSDGGTTWTVHGGTLSGRSVVGVAARGAVLVAATDQGIFRSINTGGTFTQVSGAGGSGLPAGRCSDLAGDPTSTSRLYTAVLSGNERGIFRSTDSGATWTRVSDAVIDAALVAGANGSRRTEIAVGSAGQVFLAVVDTNGRLGEVFRSSDGATGWAALGVPTTTEQNGVLFGAHPGGQGSLHLSIAADPLNAQMVYVGGDRQPYFGEGVSGSNQYFPNSSGANDYSGRLFRADASLPAGSRWALLTHSGTSNNSSPHADSRDMAFDGDGNLLESDDGGVYRRTQPRTSSGVWQSLNGDLQVTEYHGIAYDAVANRVIGGAQDTGTTEQRNTVSRIFDSVSTGDGGDTVVEDRASATSSTRYSSFQYLSSLRRRTFNASNTVTGAAFPARTVLAGGPALQAQFYTPLAVNDASATRLLIGAQNGVYESLDRGDTITHISALRVNSGRGDPLEYGVPGNPDFLLLGSGTQLHRRTTAGGSISALATLPGTVTDVAVDFDDIERVFAITDSTVQRSINGGATLTAITGNLISGFSPGTLRAMVFVPGTLPGVVVAADRGVFVAYADTQFSTWFRLGSELPQAVVFELEYDRTDDVLVAGTLGRGAWRLEGVRTLGALLRDGFE